MFLQNIDYKANPEAINEEFKLRFDNEEKIQTENQINKTVQIEENTQAVKLEEKVENKKEIVELIKIEPNETLWNKIKNKLKMLFVY